jgi:hypothetical protein
MPTAFPRAVVYDVAAECHLTVLVRRDKDFFSYFCADHGTEERFPLLKLESFKQWLAAEPVIQVCSWVEVVDNGD